VAGLLLGPHLHRVVRFGTTIAGNAIRALLSQEEWTPWERLPRWVQVESRRQGPGRFRGRRAGIEHVPEARKFRDGWLMDLGGRLIFLYRRGLGAGGVVLETLAWEEAEVGPLALRVSVGGPERPPSALFLHPRSMWTEPHK
jgi:hypothetical protein